MTSHATRSREKLSQQNNFKSMMSCTTNNEEPTNNNDRNNIDYDGNRMTNQSSLLVTEFGFVRHALKLITPLLIGAL